MFLPHNQCIILRFLSSERKAIVNYSLEVGTDLILFTELSIQSLTKQTLYVYVVPEHRIVHIDTLLKRLAPSRCLEATWDIRKLLQLKSCGTI